MVQWLARRVRGMGRRIIVQINYNRHRRELQHQRVALKLEKREERRSGSLMGDGGVALFRDRADLFRRRHTVAPLLPFSSPLSFPHLHVHQPLEQSR